MAQQHVPHKIGGPLKQTKINNIQNIHNVPTV